MTQVASPLIKALEITYLPSLPHVLLRVLDMCNSDDVSLHAIADIIGNDAALSSKVIGASSAAHFGRQNKLDSLEQKLRLLGLDTVKTIVISSSFYQVFNNLNISPGFDLKSFWVRSLTAAFLAKLIAQEMAYPHPEEAYFTGLLLNIGELVLWSNFPRQYATLLVNKVDDAEFLLQETEKLGNNHCEVGAWLVTRWNLTSFMSDAVLYHHMPRNKIVDTHPLIQIAHLANQLSLIDADHAAQIPSEHLMGISAVNVARLIENAEVQVSKMAKSIGIDIEATQTSSSDEAHADNAERDNMRQQKVQLAMELRDIVLIGRNPLSSGGAISLDDTLSSIQRSVHILFGFQNMFFFLPDPHHLMLVGKCLSGPGILINEMSIPLNKQNSIVTDAFLTRKPSIFFRIDDKPVYSLLDEQIVRQMQAEGFYCQPLINGDSVVGVMILGLSQTLLVSLKKQQKMLTLFAQQAAQAIAMLNAFNEQETRIKLEVMASSKAHTQQILHEASNPLGIIQNYIKLLGIKLPKDDPAQHDLRIIKEEIDRVTRICQTISVAVTTDSTLQGEVNVNEVIENLCKIFLEPLFTMHQIVVHTQFDSALPNIVTSKDKVIQILVNLMKNAAEAMRNGGELQIATRTICISNGGEYIEISLKDDGPGIPVEIMKNLFTPVASSKGTKHAGLGLSIVKNIIDELGGKVFCQSNQMSGTLFQIQLPLNAS